MNVQGNYLLLLRKAFHNTNLLLLVIAIIMTKSCKGRDSLHLVFERGRKEKGPCVNLAESPAGYGSRCRSGAISS